MNQVSISSLGDLKTVFNSPEDNVHFFNVVSKSFNQNSHGVQLAKPILRNNVHQIIWKAEGSSELRSLGDASETEKRAVGTKIKAAFDEFEEKSKAFKNFPPDFISQLKEIPNLSSVLFSDSDDGNLNVVITNWGFLEDKIDRVSGILQSIFPAPSHSILVKAVSEGGVPQSGKKIYLESESHNSSDVTDDRGYARLGDVTRGGNFDLKNENGRILSANCVADGRSEYLVEFEREVLLTFKVVCKDDKVPASNVGLVFKSTNIGSVNVQTDANGVFTINHPDTKEEFSVLFNGDEVISSNIPIEDDSFEVEVTCKEEVVPPLYEPPQEDPLEEEEYSTNLRFSNFFNRPLKNLAFSVHKNESEESGSKIIRETNLNTDRNGAAAYTLEEGEHTVQFKRFGIPWTYSFVHTTGISTHHFRPRGIFPWLWWIINAILIFLLLCCLLEWKYCWICNGVEHHKEEVIEEDPIVEDELPVFGLDWDLELDNPCANDSWQISKNNTQIIFVIEDSENCGGECEDVQSGKATANITVGEKDVYLDLDFTGIGELELENYETIQFYLDGTKIANGHAAGGGKGCEFGPVVKEYHIQGPYKLEKGSKHAFEIVFTTEDGLYHVDCYYQVNLSFGMDDDVEVIID